MAVDYMGFVNNTDPWAKMDQSLSGLQQAMMQRQQMQRQSRLDDLASQEATQQRTLRDLQIGDERAKQQALMSQYGAKDLGQAYAFQTEEQQMQKEKDSILAEVTKMAAIDPKAAIDHFNQRTGAKLTYQGSKDDHIQIKDEQTGRLALYNWRTGETKEVAQLTPKEKPAPKVEEIPSPDGKTAQKFQFNPQTGKFDIPIAPPYKVKSQVPKVVVTGGGGGGKSGGASAPKPGKPLPPAALKLQDEHLNAIGTASGIAADLAGVQRQLESGELELGLWENAKSWGKNATGFSDPNSRNFATFKATLEKLRNDSLKLNKGVQTEGDAVRAWNEILTNLNDGELVKQRLAEVQTINDRAVTLRRNSIDVLRENYGKESLDTTPFEQVPSATGGKAPKPSTPTRKGRPTGGGYAELLNKHRRK